MFICYIWKLHFHSLLKLHTVFPILSSDEFKNLSTITLHDATFYCMIRFSLGHRIPGLLRQNITCMWFNWFISFYWRKIPDPKRVMTLHKPTTKIGGRCFIFLFLFPTIFFLTPNQIFLFTSIFKDSELGSEREVILTTCMYFSSCCGEAGVFSSVLTNAGGFRAGRTRVQIPISHLPDCDLGHIPKLSAPHQ